MQSLYFKPLRGPPPTRLVTPTHAHPSPLPQALSKTGSVLASSPLRVLPSKTAIVPVNKDLMPRTNDELERCSRTVYVANIDKKVDKEDVRSFFEQLCGECGGGAALPHAILHQAAASKRRSACACVCLPCLVQAPCPAVDLPLPRSHPHQFTHSLPSPNHPTGKVRKIRLLGDFAHSTRIAFIEFGQAEGAMAALNCSGALLGALPLRVSPSKTPVRGDLSDDED